VFVLKRVCENIVQRLTLLILIYRCEDGAAIRAHRVVLAAASPFLKWVRNSEFYEDND